MSDLKNLTKEQLIALVAALEEAKQTLTDATEVAKAENQAQADEIVSLKAQIDTKDEELAVKRQELAAKNEELATAENMLEEQQEALGKLESSSGPSDKTVVSFNGEKYIVVAPRFLMGSRECTAQDLVGDSDLVGQLIEKKSGVLQPFKQ